MSTINLKIINISWVLLNEVQENLTLDEKTFSKHKERLIEQELGNANYLIALLNELPVGHVFIKWKGSKQPIIKNKLQRCPHIEDIFVSPPNRNRKIGEKLIKKCIYLAKEKKFNQIGLGVEESNKKAKGLYSRFNFIEADINSYQDVWTGEDREGNKTGPFSSLVKYFICKIN